MRIRVLTRLGVWLLCGIGMGQTAARLDGASHRLKDWTDGCIAVADQEIDEIWLAVVDGTPIEIRP